MHIQLFGNFGINDGEAVQLQTTKIRALVAYLAANANRPIERATLATLFWGDNTTDVANRNLRNSLSRLRKAFKPLTARYGADLLTITRQHVELATVSGVTIDAARFDALWRTWSTAPKEAQLTDGSVQAALEALATVYRGPFLQDVLLDDCIEFDSWLMLQRNRYGQRALIALTTLVEQAIAAGKLESAERYAKRILALEPWHEAAHRQLITIYRLMRRPAAAQAQFEACKVSLQEALLVEPSAQTVAALSILPDGDEVQPTGETPPAAVRKRHDNVPAALNKFVGRAAEADHVAQLLTARTTRLITLHGQGGIGKSRLARTVATQQAEAFADGVCYVPLAGVDSAEIFPNAVAEALALNLNNAKNAFEAVCTYLQDREMLLVLDNFEQLLTDDDAVDYLLKLLDRAPNIMLLVTSRRQLWVRAETVVRLDGLPFPADKSAEDWQNFAATQLFIARKRQHNITFDAESARDAVIRICSLLEGLPLGIELAAAQSSYSSCEQIAAELEHAFTLATRLRDYPPRQRSLQRVFDYSWALLEPEIRPMLARCAIFRHDFDFAAFNAVTNGSLDHFETLISHALIRYLGEDRYDLHEVVRRFAEERLSAEERLASEQAFADHFLKLVASKETLLFTAPRDNIEAIRQEWRHVVLAWELAIRHNAFVRLSDAAIALRNYWEIGSRTRSAIAMMAAGVAACQAAGPSQAARLAKMRLQAVLCLLYWRANRFEQLKTLIAEITATHDPQVEASGLTAALLFRGVFEYIAGDTEQATQSLESAYDLGLSHRLPLWLGLVIEGYLRAVGNNLNGQLERAEAILNRWQQFRQFAPGPFFEAHYLKSRGWLRYRQWRLSEAIADQDRYRSMMRSFGTVVVADESLGALSLAYLHVGDYANGVEVLHPNGMGKPEDERYLLTVGTNSQASWGLRKLGKLDSAILYGRRAIELSQGFKHGIFYVRACQALGLALCEKGDYQQAINLFEDAAASLAKERIAFEWQFVIDADRAHAHALAGDCETAYGIIDPLIEPLLDLSYLDLRIEQAWFCYKILHFYGDPRAKAVKSQAQRVLEKRALQLTEPTHLDLFLHNVPEHRWLLDGLHLAHV